MKKKLLSVLLALALLCPTVAASAAASKFVDDVPENAWFYEAVDYVSDQGWFNGTSETSFSPKQSMDRGMFVTVLGRQAGVDIASYEDDTAYFYDVNPSAYYGPYVKWAASYEIVNGTKPYYYSPKKAVTRQEMAALMYRYASATGNDLSIDKGILDSFPDVGDVASWAKDAVAWAVTHKVINGSDGKLLPKDTASRAQVAQIFYNCRDLFPNKEISRDPIVLTVPPVIEKPETPSKPETPAAPTFSAPTTFNSNGAIGVEFNPAAGYSAQVVLGNDRLYNWEAADSIVSRTGAMVAVNGGVFQCYDEAADNFLTVYSTLINNGKILRLDNARTPMKPTFVIDSDGVASIEHLKTIQNVYLVQDGERNSEYLPEVVTNLRVSTGGPRMIYTREYGDFLEGTIAKGALVDENGVITQVIQSPAENVGIPEKGYLVCERTIKNQWDTFFDKCRVGDTLEIEVSYEGSSKQNIAYALSAGPTLVKGGQAYGNDAAYIEEGFDDPKVTGGAELNRMAIGVKADGTVVIASFGSASMGQMSQALVALGCKDAMSLDGGGSTNLYANGVWHAGPTGRAMASMLVFTQK